MLLSGPIPAANTSPGSKRRKARTSSKFYQPRRRPRLELLEDRTLLSPYVVTTTADSGLGSLRDAITQTNADISHSMYTSLSDPTKDEIDFDIPTTDVGYQSSTGSFLIQPAPAPESNGFANFAGLPAVTEPVIINGYTQPDASGNTLASGDNAVLKIQLDGSNAGNSGVGLVLSGGNTTVCGLVISDWGADGVWSLSDKNDISGNFVGTDVTGKVAQPNSPSPTRLAYNLPPNSAITISGAYNLIGGTDRAERNLVSGNLGEAITIAGTPGSPGSAVDGSIVEGNFIGTNVDGTSGLANQGDGINVWGAPDTIIGGASPAARNVISDNKGMGETTGGNPGSESEINTVFSDNFSIEGNYIGTDVTGTLGLGFGPSDTGIKIDGGAGWTIGGTTSGAGNLISVHGVAGIIAGSATGAVIQGNFIGTDYSGTFQAGSQSYGIALGGCSNCLIGGSGSAARNLISASNIGIDFATCENSTIAGNFIGTAASGIGPHPWGIGGSLGNAAGIVISAGSTFNIIGPGNVIADSEFAGVQITDSGTTNNVVSGNFIGTDVTGTIGQANYVGVQIENGAGNNTIGGTPAGAGNVIAFNGNRNVHSGGGFGVVVGSSSSDTATIGNSILGNSIFGNQSLGIDLLGTGVPLQNDSQGHIGPNDFQNFPVLTGAAIAAVSLTVSGTLHSVPNTSFRLEFFANAVPDASGYGQGQTFLGYANVTSDNNGNATFPAAALAALPAGQNYVSATATNLSTGDTSEFSLNLLIAPTVTTVTSSANPSFFGQNVTFTATVAAAASGVGTPTGSVDFIDTTTGVNLGTVPLSGGIAMLSTSSLPAGANTITAFYSGGSNFAGSNEVIFLASSGNLAQTVLPSILVLDPNAGGALSLSGNASIKVPGVVVVDSSSTSALSASGNATVNASSIQVVGNFKKSGNASLSPAPVTGAAFVANPLAALTGPSTSGLTNYDSASYSGNGSYTLNPGIYTQIRVSGNAKATLNPGLYLIEGGGLTVSGNASISGTGIMIYNTGSNYPSAGGNFGGITLSGNGTFSLTASATSANGTDAGILIFQPTANTRALSFGGNGVAGITGTVYAPSAQVVISGNASLGGSLIADELSLSGNGVSTQVADGSAGSQLDNASAGTLLAGNLFVYVSDPSGLFTANELSRIQDAINAWDSLLVPYSVTIAEVSDPSLANVVIDTGTTSAAGSASSGVLGCYNSTGEITILQGWNWYDGSDPSQISSAQYDFQTVVTHELGHALGLGGSSDPSSPMFETLATGVVRRTSTAADLNIPAEPEGADPERAAMPTVGLTFTGFIAVSQSIVASRVELGGSIPLEFADAPVHLAHGAGLDSPGFVWQGPGAVGTMFQRTDSGTTDELGLDPVMPLPGAQDLILPNDSLPFEDLDWNYLLQDLGSVTVPAGTPTNPVTSDSGQAANEQTLLGMPMNEWFSMEAPKPQGISPASGVPAGLASLANAQASTALLEMRNEDGRGVVDIVFAALCATALVASDPEPRRGRAPAKPRRGDR
jgi:hypothetical protein